MTPWQRDLIAVLGVAFLAVAAYLVHPALALGLIGAALLLVWYLSVPEKDEADDGSGHSS
jgi:Flp pilus assembly protein TadB